VSPREGPASGGTRLVIRGSCLGRDQSDVVGLFICGSNVLSSLQFVSSSKLVCTTKPHRAGTGSVTVETQTGGRGTSLVTFTFVEHNAAPTPQPTTVDAPSVSTAVPLTSADMPPVSNTH